MATLGPDGTVIHGNERHLTFEPIAGLLHNFITHPEPLATGLLGLALIIFSIYNIVAQLETGWVVISATVPITFVCGLIAVRVAFYLARSVNDGAA